MKKNWIYIVLFCLIVAVNVLPRFMERREPQDVIETEPAKSAKEPTLFVDFEEAQKRSQRIESVLRKDLPLYLFYLSLNAIIIFIFVLGLAVDGYFLFGKFKRKEFFKKIGRVNPPLWEISEIFKIIILALIASYVFFIMFGFFIGLSEGITGRKFEFYKDENFRMIFDTIILDFAILLVIFRFLRNVHRKRLADMGFMRENIAGNIFYGVCGYVGIIPVIVIIGIMVYILLNILKLKPPPQPIVELFLAEKDIALILVSSMIAAIFGPVIEEIFFRGVMYNAVKRRVGISWAIFITSVIFSFLHTHAMSYFLVGFIPIAVLGVVLAYLYEKTGSLIPSITLHILNNMGSVIMVFLYKYFNSLVA